MAVAYEKRSRLQDKLNSEEIQSNENFRMLQDQLEGEK